jgi:hypothetical protein
MLNSLWGGGSDAYEKAAKSSEKAGDVYGKYAEKERGSYADYLKEGKSDIDKYLQQGMGYTSPYRQAGEQSLDAYKASLGLPSSSKYSDVLSMFHESPGYQFALEQGQKSRMAAAAAGGGALSGGLLKELTSYGQGMANQEFGGWQNRLQGLTELGSKLSSQAESETVGAGNTIGGYDLATGQLMGKSYEEQGSTAANALLEAAKLRAQGEMSDINSGRALIGDLAKVGGYMFGGAAGGAAASAATEGGGSWFNKLFG